MSVVVVTDHYRTIRRLISCLNAQTVCDQLEVVIVAPAGADLGLDPTALEGFAGVQVVKVERVNPMSAGRAAGVRAATAPIIFIGARRGRIKPRRANAAWRLRRILRPAGDPSYVRALRAFVAEAEGGPRQAASLEDGIRSLEVVLAAEESARTAKPVSPQRI